MYEVETELEFGIVEIRKYDDQDRLIEIRKRYPSEIHVTGVKQTPRRPGTRGGDRN